MDKCRYWISLGHSFISSDLAKVTWCSELSDDRPPKRYVYILILSPLRMWPCLEKRVFADVMTLIMILRWDYLGLPGCVLNPMMSVLMRNRRGEDRERETHVEMDTHWSLCSHKLRNAWSHQNLEEKWKNSPQKPSKEVWSHWPLDFGLLASRTMTEYIFLWL